LVPFFITDQIIKMFIRKVQQTSYQKLYKAVPLYVNGR
jgi:hypothetical protein